MSTKRNRPRWMCARPRYKNRCAFQGYGYKRPRRWSLVWKGVAREVARCHVQRLLGEGEPHIAAHVDAHAPAAVKKGRR